MAQVPVSGTTSGIGFGVLCHTEAHAGCARASGKCLRPSGNHCKRKSDTRATLQPNSSASAYKLRVPWRHLPKLIS